MIHNEAFEIKMSRNATEKVHSPSYINLTWQCSEKQSFKSLKWTLMINYFLHEPKTRKDFMILPFKTRLKKQSHSSSRVSFYKFSRLNYSLKQNSNYVLLISFTACEQIWNLSSVANPKSTKKWLITKRGEISDMF